MTFENVLMQCAGTPEFVTEFDRLSGCNLSRKGTPINILIDDATGKTNEDLGKFIEFVFEFIYLPWLAKMKEGAT